MKPISHSFFSWVQAPFGAVGIGTRTRTWAVLSSIPEGTCACGAEGPMASIGPLARWMLRGV